MHIYGASRTKIELEPVQTDIIAPPGDQLMFAARGSSESVSASSMKITRAAAAFLGYGGPAASRAATIQGRTAPVVVRESGSGLLRAYRNEVVVRFKPRTAAKTCKAILEKHGFEIRRTNAYVKNQHIVHSPNRQVSGELIIDVANDWAEMDEVLFASPNFVSEYRRTVVLPKPHAEQWHLVNRGRAGQKKGEDVGALEAWKFTRGKASIVVAVLDDGVDIGHPNLKSRIAAGGRDFFVPDDHPEYTNPRPKLFRFPFDQMSGNDIHGTPCAGVIAAAGVNRGAVGIAPRCKILPIKIFHADDFAADERVADAIRYSAANADILSCSWAGGSSPDIELALQDAGAARDGKGAAIFCAAGNEGRALVGFPARDPNAIAVGASTDGGTRASYSNIGPEIAVVAPSSGGARGIYTTDVSIPQRGFNIGTKAAGGVNGLHTNDFGGTSSATPLVAGIAALLLSVKPELTRDQVRAVLVETADKIGGGYDANGHSFEFGFGRVNAAKALAKVME
jgi:subtilisin family serine protease